ncbi:NAD(P)-dependent dehydrogenase (short-subunit alcohol dehydrogenase family) [Paenibacillus phyllosphaerae]|uniref:NAD(P)-dependent dehydrogenase (Short-subunit alcohol dehydrogenase family) n=1 Tax=Paenibacillus phyllosphaerae TaxID=274593 RepID=A0A7W5FPK6_9BACL|nr:SDR family NAD(P)-dependent oxidoreductase [Paenibacillus phyllosphaerae]MBB3112139.1 NAD(P)-dependent dehydrogenase (short-subunit alcohol dehydrogenase family) [Paenibacillus phyllosphaerae]
MTKVWFITGAARGLGAEIAKAALAAGDKVVATARRPESIRHTHGTSDNLLAVGLDVTREDQVKEAVSAAVAHFGRIDVLVNNAGYGQLGVFEETTLEEIRDQYETNVFGLMAVTQEVAPLMRKQRSGRIFNISSVAGFKGVFGGSIYNSSKFAVEGFTQAIAEELAHFGILVTSISPGFFRTDFLDSSSVKYSNHTIADYDKPLADFRDFHDDRNHEQAGDPAKLAKVLLHLAEVEKPPVSFIAGSDGLEWVTEVHKNLQSQIEE